MKKQFYTPIILLIALSLSCGEPKNNTVTNNTTNTAIHSDTLKSKSEDDNITKAAKVSLDLLEMGIDRANEKRDARNEAKEPMWVYKIGSPIGNLKQAMEECYKLKAISNIFIFKKDKRHYYIIKDDGYIVKQPSDSTVEVTKRVSSYTSSRVISIDLSQECDSKKYPTKDGTKIQKINGEVKQVECFSCN